MPVTRAGFLTQLWQKYPVHTDPFLMLPLIRFLFYASLPKWHCRVTAVGSHRRQSLSRHMLTQIETTKGVALLEESGEEAAIYLRNGIEETRKKVMDPMYLWAIVNGSWFLICFKDMVMGRIGSPKIHVLTS